MATHVVTAIEYGADAFFVFDRQESSSESCHEVEGKLTVALSKIPIMNMSGIGGAGSVQMNEEEKKLANSFVCTFHGDVVLKENPTTFDDAMAIYKKLPALIRESTNQGSIYGVPKRAYLYPLSKLDSRAAKLVRLISNNIVFETQAILEHIIHISATANDLENSDICRKFWGVKQQVVKFKSLLSQFQSSFRSMLCEMLPKIRGGGMEENQLLKMLNKIKSSPYDTTKLDIWLEIKKREFACLQNYLEALKEFSFALQAGELEQLTQAANQDYVLCFSFGNITGSENAFLDLMKEFLALNENENMDDDILATEESWCDDDTVMANIQSKIHQFKNFAAANSNQKNLKFVVSDASSKKGKSPTSCSMILFTKNGRQVFQPPTSPGQPQVISNAENEITISWTLPTLGAKNILFYKILYLPVGATDSSWSHVETENLETQFTVKQLASETEYLFKVEAVSEPGKSQAGPESLPIKTKSPPPLALSILDQCQKIASKNGQPSWYQLPRPGIDIDTRLHLKTVNIGQVHPEPQAKIHKVVLMVGATGAGKSTLVNGMVNYLYGVKKDDPFRLQLIPKESNESQAHSQTSNVTQYILHWQPGSRVPYTMVFIDTPGFADTRGIMQDNYLIQQLRLFFNKAIDHIDAVGFVVQSSLPRLTETQKYIFDGILSLFGKDIEKNIFLMLTFTDGSLPPVLSAVHEFGIQYVDYFKFNNSVFTMGSDKEKQVELTENAIKINGMFWDMAYTAYQDFFNKLRMTKAKSLMMTREVLEGRQRLEESIDVLSLRINDGVNQLVIMREELPFIIEYEAEKNANKDYIKTIDVPKTRRVEFDDGHFVTNCAKCSQTCHNDCKYAKDSDKMRCNAMGADGNCTVCKNRCYWNVHFHKNYYYEEYIAQEDITIADMKRKYLEANSKLSLKDNLLLGISKEYDKVQKDVLEAVEMIRKCLERLSIIAMRPDPLSTVEYIDMLIKATKRDKQPGWQQRLDQLDNAYQRAKLIKEMQDKGKEYDPFADLQEQIKNKASENKGLKEKILIFFRYKK